MLFPNIVLFLYFYNQNKNVQFSHSKFEFGTLLAKVLSTAFVLPVAELITSCPHVIISLCFSHSESQLAQFHHPARVCSQPRKANFTTVH